jgi:hypothetical protein
MVRALGRRTETATGRVVQSFGDDRVCAALGCDVRLSRYNPDAHCWIHTEPSLPSGAKRARG